MSAAYTARIHGWAHPRYPWSSPKSSAKVTTEGIWQGRGRKAECSKAVQMTHAALISFNQQQTVLYRQLRWASTATCTYCTDPASKWSTHLLNAGCIATTGEIETSQYNETNETIFLTGKVVEEVGSRLAGVLLAAGAVLGGACLVEVGEHAVNLHLGSTFGA